MVRIVNGEIVQDNARVRSEPVEANKNVFPETFGAFGSLSNTVSLLGYQSEIIWLLILFGAGWLFGGKTFLIIGFILFIYNRNHATYMSRQTKISTFPTIR